jgi:glycine C-acetyltransferase
LSTDHLDALLAKEMAGLKEAGLHKGRERVIAGFRPAAGERGPRWLLEGEEGREFLRMNSNSYLGLSLHPQVVAAGEEGVRAFGAGPGAVRFIGGTSIPHVRLEERLASFHRRRSAMIFSSAYGAVMGILPLLVTAETVVVSDELNHSSIINALRLSRPAGKVIYPHLDMEGLERGISEHAGRVKRALVVTDGIFSMRGDHAPFDRIAAICDRCRGCFEDGLITVVDDSHGVGAFGRTGRGTEEHCGARADVLIGTLGKALGVNGGYAVSSTPVIDYLREQAPFYVYSNPVSAGEAAAAGMSLSILDSPRGIELLKNLRRLTGRFREGLRRTGYETLDGDHPVVPLLTGDGEETSRLVQGLYERGILVTGLNYPVVPKGDEEIRFQIAADHTTADIDFALATLRELRRPREGQGP